MGSSDTNKIPFGHNWGHVESFDDLTWTDYSYYNNYPYEGYHCSGHGKEDPVLSGIPMLEWVERQVPGGNANMSNWAFYGAIGMAVLRGIRTIHERRAIAQPVLDRHFHIDLIRREITSIPLRRPQGFRVGIGTTRQQRYNQ